MAWNRPSNDGRANTPGSPRRAGTTRPTKWIVAVAAVVLAAVGAWYAVAPSSPSEGVAQKPTKAAGKIAEVTPAKPRAVPVAAVEEEQPSKPVVKGCEKWANAKGLDPKLFPYEDGRKVIETRTNQWRVVDICIMPDGTDRKVLRNARKPLFKHYTDNLILRIVSSGNDTPGPPMPMTADMDDDFRASLNDPIEIGPDDTPEEREAKELVKESREAAKEMLDRGMSFYDALTDHIAMQGSNQSARELVMESVEKLRSSGETDLIDDYLKESNRVLENMGASPIRLEETNDESEEATNE